MDCISITVRVTGWTCSEKYLTPENVPQCEALSVKGPVLGPVKLSRGGPHIHSIQHLSLPDLSDHPPPLVLHISTTVSQAGLTMVKYLL